MARLATTLFMVVAPVVLAAAEPKGSAMGSVTSIPGCTQFTTVDGTTQPACIVDTITQEVTQTSWRHTGASETSALSVKLSEIVKPPPSLTKQKAQPTVPMGTSAQPQSAPSVNSVPEPVTQLMPHGTDASAGFIPSTFITSKVPGIFGHYTNSTIESTTILVSQTASAVVGTAPVPVEVSSSRRLVGSGVIGTAAIPAAPFSVPTEGPYTVTLKETSAAGEKETALELATTKNTAKASKESAGAKPTPSCTVPHNPHFGACILKDIVSKSKLPGTNALVTGTASRKIYDAICDCKKVHNVSENATMPEPVEVCGILMCPNQVPESRNPQLAGTGAVVHRKPSSSSSSKHPDRTTKKAEQPTLSGSAAANGG